MSTHRLYSILTVFVALIVLCPLVFYPAYYSPFGSTKVMAFVALTQLAFPVYTAILWRKERPFSGLKHPIVLVFGGLILAMLVSSIFGVDPINSFVGTGQRLESTILFAHLFLATLYLYEVCSYRYQWKERLTSLLIAMGTLAASYALLEGWLFPTFVTQNGRAASLFGNPIFFASFLILPFAFAVSRSFKKEQRLWYGIASLVMLIGIILSGTRGAFLGLTVGAVVFFILHTIRYASRTQFLRRGALALVLLAMLAGSLFIIPETSRFSRFTSLSDANIGSRLDYWQMGVESWKTRPLFGLGPGNFYRAADQLFTEDTYVSSDSWADKPHNTLVEWLSTTGIVGLGLYLALIGLLLRALWKRDSDATLLVLMAGLAASLVQGLFVFHTFSELLTFCFLIAWILPGRANDSETSRAFSWAGISAAGALMLVAMLLFTLPYHRQMKVVYAGDTLVEAQQLDEAFSVYQTLSTETRVLDDLLISQRLYRTTNTLFDNRAVTAEQIDQAIEQHQLSTERHPLRALTWSNLAHLLYVEAYAHDTPVTDEGFSAVHKAIELAPGRFEPKRTLAMMHVLNAEYEEAETLLMSMLETFPNEPSPYLILSEIAFAQGDLETAAGYASEFALQVPHIVELERLQWFVSLLAEVGAHETIIEITHAWIEYHPEEETLVLPSLAATYATVGDIENAIDVAERLKVLDPLSAESVYVFIQSLN